MSVKMMPLQSAAADRLSQKASPPPREGAKVSPRKTKEVQQRGIKTSWQPFQDAGEPPNREIQKMSLRVNLIDKGMSPSHDPETCQ